MSKGWGFAIDYDKEIAYDLARLAEIEGLIALGIVKSDEHAAGGYYQSLVQRAALDPAVATTLGLTEEERDILAAYTEIETGTRPINYDTLPKGWYTAGEVLCARLSAIWSDDLPSAAELKALRSKYKTDLARHRRNKDKFTGQ